MYLDLTQKKKRGKKEKHLWGIMLLLSFCNRAEIIPEKRGNTLHLIFIANYFDETVLRKVLWLRY